MTRARRVLAVTLVAAAMLGLVGAPARAATEIYVSFSVTRTSSGPAMYDVTTSVWLPMDRIDADGYLWNGARIELRYYGDDVGPDPLIVGPLTFSRTTGVAATDIGVVLVAQWQEFPGSWLNEDNGYGNYTDALYVKARWIDADGGTLQATSNVVTGIF